MKQVKYLVFLITMLWACTTFADISGRLDSLRTMVYEQSLVPKVGTPIVTDSVTNRFVNRAIQKVCVDFPAIEATDTVVSAVGTIEYALNTDFLRLKNIFKLTTYQDLKIIYSLSFPPAESWFEAKAGEIGGQGDPQEKPEPRYASAFNDNVYLYPTPQRADSFVVTYYAIDRQLVSVDSITNIRPEFREAIVWYGAFLVATRRGDYDRAKFCLDVYYSMKRENEVTAP